MSLGGGAVQYMVYNCVLRQWPADMFRLFQEGRNLFPTTIFVLVSAIQKIARVMLNLLMQTNLCSLSDPYINMPDIGAYNYTY